MTVRTECVSVVYCVITAGRERDFVMNLKIRRSITQAQEGGGSVAELALAGGAMENFYDHIRVTPECTRNNLNLGGLLGRRCEPKRSLFRG